MIASSAEILRQVEIARVKPFLFLKNLDIG